MIRALFWVLLVLAIPAACGVALVQYAERVAAERSADE